MIVVDLGCAAHGEDRSLEPLIERFNPDLYFGFDALPLDEGVTRRGETTLVLARRAAWTYDGWIEFTANGLRTHVGSGKQTLVPCFDFATWLCTLPREQPIIVKMDIEGAEYPILERMYTLQTDTLIECLLVEYHYGVAAHQLERQLPQLRCRMEEW